MQPQANPLLGVFLWSAWCPDVQHIELAYTLLKASTPERRIRNALMDLLQAVRSHGSISGAARVLGLSYRHVWGELKRWEQALGQELIVWDKGQAARLSAFGDRLLWAERQAQARLTPQIEALHADLERALAQAFEPAIHVLKLHASHDDALALLRQTAALGGDLPTCAGPALHLDIEFTGSVDAIRDLNRGRCAMAGFHTLLLPAVGSMAQRAYKPLLKPGQHKLIGFARRWQGLMVAPGNPLRIQTLADIRPHRLVNRPLGSGTRLVLDELLAQARLLPGQIQGYAHTENSHNAVAHTVASGQADVGVGIASAAKAHGLEFVPLVQEQYHLVCLKAALDDPATRRLREVLGSTHWQTVLNGLAGYAASDSGSVQSLRKVLPWWTFKT